jgi:hypothetical protein
LLNQDPTPNWTYWRIVPTVSLLEAVVLTLNVDPSMWVPLIAGGGPAGLAEKGYLRLDLARRCLGETLTAAKPRYGEEQVRLKEFVPWAIALDWTLPDALRELGGVPSGDFSSAGSTVAAETRCREWLIGEMRKGAPTRARKKYQEEAHQRFGVGPRPFGRAWDRAKEETEATS